MRYLAVITLFSGVFVMSLSAATPPPTPPSVQAASVASQRALLDKYCVTCHNQRTRAAGLLLDEAHVDRLSDDPATWEKVIKKLRTGAMPPVGLPRPDAATLDGFQAW